MMKIKGEFSVTLNPLEAYSSAMGRRSIDKHFTGPLAAASKGEMLSIMGNVQGSAAYVAIEQVTGTLEGKVGSFALQHYGVMNRGESHLLLEVVPDSGTGELVGLVGKMTIIMENGKHFYEFEYNIKPS